MDYITPFASLLSLDLRSQQMTGELPSKENTQMLWAGLGFNLLGQRFVVPMGEAGKFITGFPFRRNPSSVSNWSLLSANAG